MDSPETFVPPTAGELSTENERATGGQEPQGILLYYKYLNLKGNDAQEVAAFYEELCHRLDLCGRIRVARDGVNVTVGGSVSDLRVHSSAVVAHPLLRGGDIDFKLAQSHGSRNEATRHETKMDTLVVRQCEELVTLGPLARNRADPRVNTAPHLTPEQFHGMLQRAAAAAGEVSIEKAGAAVAGAERPSQPPPQQQQQQQQPAAAAEPVRGSDDGGDGNVGVFLSDTTVLLDARNIYETRIGHFDAGPSVATLDPRTRCFSDLPAWMDAHEEQLRNRTVLMYCTGGVRCERASAYLRDKGPGFDRVFQLSGGIQRYLECFPDGGFFRGKNFLYDDRIAVGPGAVAPQADGAVVGRCLLCGSPWDDYGARHRCSRCRLLLLICDDCKARKQQRQDATAANTSATASAGAGSGEAGPLPPASSADGPHRHSPGKVFGLRLLCELCAGAASEDIEVSGDGCTTTTSADVSGLGAVQLLPENQLAAAGAAPYAVAASGGSAGSSTRQAAPVHPPGSSSRTEEAVAAPATAAASPPPRLGGLGCCPAASAAAGHPAAAAAAPRRRLRILCLHGFRQTGKQFQGRTCALRKKLRDLADFVFVDAPHTLPLFVKVVERRRDIADVEQGRRDSTGGVEGIEGICDHKLRANGSVEGKVAALVNYNTEFGGTGESSGGEKIIDSDDSDVAGEGVHELRQCDSTDVQSWRRQGRAAATGGALTGVALAAAKRAWLVPPELYVISSGTETAATVPAAAPPYVDELQYTRQTEGWRESLSAVQRAVRALGPFDGVFGFSQGAAVAAVLCALQQQHRRQRRQQQQQQLSADADAPCAPKAPKAAGVVGAACAMAAAREAPCSETPPGSAAEGSSEGAHDLDFGFRFAILASGFPSPVRQHRDLLAQVGPLELPSLHVYGTAYVKPTADGGDAAGATGDGKDGGGGGDRQIPPRESELLAAFFANGGGRGGGSSQRRALRHQSGHLIPATKSHAATFRAFLEQFTL